VPLANKSAYKIIDPPAGTDELTIELRFDTGRSVSGTIVDPDGQPLAGCTVGGLTVTYDKLQTMTEATFTAAALDPERPRTVVFLHPGRKLAGTVKLSGAEPNTLTVKLAATGAITGRILDAEGKPVPGASVAVRYYDRAVHRSASSGVFGRDDHQADPDGRFRIEGLIPGERFDVGFQVKGRWLDAGKGPRELTIVPGETKDLGDIRTRPYGQ
jgi:protocatechuate 3,4-dioxygenase beta subunit